METSTQSNRKTTFADIYRRECGKPTPRQAFLAECAQATGLSAATIKQWANGVQVPNKSALKLLAAHLNCDPDGLFPNPKKAPL